MAKTKHSFIVTVQTEDEVKAADVAKTIRATLSGVKFWHGIACWRKSIGVKKVTVVNVGER